MQIRQLQIANDATQDRLLLRVSSPANEEYRVWITRRFLRTVWPHLAKRPPPVPRPATDNPAPQESGGDFTQAFREDNATYPLGSSPMLASEISIDKLSDGGMRLTFREGRERSLCIDLSPDLIEAFLSMLRAGGTKLEWDLPLEYDTALPTPSAPPITPETPPKARLH